MRVQHRSTADRVPGLWATAAGVDPVPGRACLPAGHRLAQRASRTEPPKSLSPVNELVGLSIREAAQRLSHKEISSAQLTEAVLNRIAETEPLVHAYAHVMEKSAREEARRADADLARGLWHGPLHGIPIAFKDLVYTTQAPTEAGSRVLEGWIPDYDATVIRKLRDGGAVVIGKTHTHEFAYGVNIPPTRNAWRLDGYPGGSSAGSGVSVAARSAFGAIGTDGGGSIRCPASLSGVVGLKPTTGRVSRHGVVPMSSTFDNVGPMTRTVEDCALMLGAMAGQQTPEAQTAERAASALLVCR